MGGWQRGDQAFRTRKDQKWSGITSIEFPKRTSFFLLCCVCVIFFLLTVDINVEQVVVQVEQHADVAVYELL